MIVMTARFHSRMRHDHLVHDKQAYILYMLTNVRGQ